MESFGTGRVQELLDIAEQAGLREDPATLELIREVGLCGDAEAVGIIQEFLRREAMPHIVEGNPFWAPPTTEQLMGLGGFPFGFCAFTGCQHRIPESEPVGNLLVTGAPGCGKTTALSHLALAAARAGKTPHIDLPRSDCRALAKYHGFRLANVRTYRINILASIRNVPRAVYIQTLAETAAHHFSLQTRGKQAMARWLKELYEQFNKLGHEPCVADFIRYLRQKTFPPGSYEKDCCTRLVDRFQSCIDYTGDMLLCERGQAFEEISDPVFFEMSGVDPQVRDFLSEVRIRREFLFRQFNPEARRRDLFELLDECLNLGRERKFSSSSREMSTPSMDVTATQTRYHNMKIVYATQVVTNLSAAIKATAVFKMAGTTLADQVYETAKLWGLDREQAEWLSKLPRGTFIARHSIDRLPRPYLLRFDAFPGLDEPIGEEEAQEIAERSMADLPWKPRWMGYEEGCSITQKNRAELGDADVTEKVFRRITERTDEICSERCAAIGIDPATESAARRELGPEGLGLIELDGKIGNLLFFRLTAKGRSVAKERGYRIWRSHASPTHSYMVKQALQGLGRVGRVAILTRQHAVNGRRPDGLFKLGDTVVAIQVCSSPGNYEREAKALLALADAPGVDLAVLVATHGQHARGVRTALRKIAGDVVWERIVILEAARALDLGFDWRSVIGGENG